MTDESTDTTLQTAPTAREDPPVVEPEDPDVLISQGVSVTVEKKVWGYKVHLNQKAVDMLAVCLTLLEEALSKCFKGELRRAVSLIIQAKQFRLKHVTERTGNNGCQLVSPWICPFALTVVRERTSEADLGLYSAVWDSATGQWGEETAFTDITSAAGPALAQHGDRLFCVYRGGEGDQLLYWMVYTSDTGWNDDAPRAFRAHWTTGVPTLVEFKGELYCLFKGGGNDSALYICKFDDANDDWTDAWRIDWPEAHSASGVGAAVLGDRLHVVYGFFFNSTMVSNNSSYLYQLTTLDCHTWERYPMEGQSKDIPALTAFNGRLHVIYRGDNNSKVWHCHSADGRTWSSHEPVLNFGTDQGPAVAAHDGKLYLIHRSSDGNGEIWFAIGDGQSWDPDVKLPEHLTGDNPALVAYRDPANNETNYEDASTVGTRLITVYRGK